MTNISRPRPELLTNFHYRYSNRITNQKIFFPIILLLIYLLLRLLFPYFIFENEVSSHSTVCQASKINHNKLGEGTMIHYQEVDQKENHFIRYAAYAMSNDEGKCVKEPLSVEKWIELLSGADSFQYASILTDVIKKTPFKAFFFETKGVSQKTLTKQFEFVLVNSPHLHTFCESNGPDLRSFAQQLLSKQCNEDDSNKYGCSFPNLSGDAQLIVPKWDIYKNELANIPTSAYSHLATFLRECPSDQINSVWKIVASQYSLEIHKFAMNSAYPIWLSTSGMGVSYLHFRLDKRPKYYTFPNFAQEK